MEQKNYREVAMKYAEKIPMDKIILSEKVHKAGNMNTAFKKLSPEELVIVANKRGNNYVLIVGWGCYMRARELGLDEIPCYVVKQSREEFMSEYGLVDKDKKFAKKDKKANKSAKKPAVNKPYNKNKEITLEVRSLLGTVNYPIEKIIIPDIYKKAKPNKEKIRLRVDYYNKFKELPQPIIIMKDGLLFDGYATYVAAKELGLEFVPVFFKNDEERERIREREMEM